LYVNGVQVASQAQTGTIATSGNPLQIGGDGFYGQYFAGIIDEVRIYNRALSAGEIGMDMTTPVVRGTASSAIAAAVTSAPASVLPAPWEGIDVGDGGLAGSETITGDVYSVTGAGTLSDLTDTFRFLYQPMSGDGEISAQIGSLDSPNADGRAGVMVRETLTSGSRYAFMGISPDGTFWSQARTSTVGSTDTTSADAGGASNLWVRLVRSGDAVYGYQSVDGNAWTAVATNSVPMASEIYMGFGVASGSSDILNTCTFTNATILP
jgi:regulation of enolase protein 1 (concanavalin A-like superfamily)